MNGLKVELKNRVWDELWFGVQENIIGAKICDQVYDEVYEQVANKVRNEVLDSVREIVAYETELTIL